MKVRTLVYIVIALMLVNVAALATFVVLRANQSERTRSWRNPDRPADFPDREFRLTEKEREALERARADFEENIKPLLDSLTDVRRAIFDELRREIPDTAIINDAIEAQGAIQTKIQNRMIKRFLADRDLMSPEHRERMLQMIEQRARGDQFWGRGKFGRPDHRRGFQRGR